ncbi:hypothetical protein V6C27_06760 [Peptococcaceae bacterium 1198_IL3148]
MTENNRFSHQQLEDTAELDDLELENFEQTQSEFVTYPDGSELEFDDLVELENDLTVEIEDLDDYELEEDIGDEDFDDDLEQFAEDLVNLDFDDSEDQLDLDDLEGLEDLEDQEREEDQDNRDDYQEEHDDLEELQQQAKAKAEQRSKEMAEARETLEGISKLLDMLIKDDDHAVKAKNANQESFRQSDREHEHRHEYRNQGDRKKVEPKPIDNRQLIDAEFKEIAQTTDHLDRMLFQKKEQVMADQYVSDLFEDRDWDLVLDDDLLLERAETILNSIDHNNEVLAKTQGVEKKSLSTLATALLAGGGVLVFGLATAGVVTLVRSRSKKSKDNSDYNSGYNYNSSYTPITEPVVQIKPAAAPEPKPEPVAPTLVAPEPVEPLQQDNLYRSMPQQHRYPPVRPFWGMMPPPPHPDDDKRMAL